jgi:hypothetical protein
MHISLPMKPLQIQPFLPPIIDAGLNAQGGPQAAG